MTKPTTLVLLPGLDGTEIFFRPLLASLPASVRPVVISLPLTGTNSYAELLDFVRRALADIPACVVLGWSFGGPLALMLAAAEPQKVRGVILVATFVRPPRCMLAGVQFALITPVVWLWRAFRRLPLWLLRTPKDPLRRAKTETWTRIPARVIVARLRAISTVDVREALHQCRQPIMCIVSRSDIFVPRQNTEEISRLRPGIRIVPIDGRHLALYTDPHLAVAAIMDFVASVEYAIKSSEKG